jgi:hypothetical protein
MGRSLLVALVFTSSIAAASTAPDPVAAPAPTLAQRWLPLTVAGEVMAHPPPGRDLGAERDDVFVFALRDLDHALAEGFTLITPAEYAMWQQKPGVAEEEAAALAVGDAAVAELARRRAEAADLDRKTAAVKAAQQAVYRAYHEPLSVLVTFGWSFVRGVTLDLADIAEGLWGQRRHEIDVKLREANPWAAAVGTIAGVITIAALAWFGLRWRVVVWWRHRGEQGIAPVPTPRRTPLRRGPRVTQRR